MKLISVIKFFIIMSLTINSLTVFASEELVPCLDVFWVKNARLSNISYRSGRSRGYYIVFSHSVRYDSGPISWSIVVSVDATDFGNAFTKAKEKILTLSGSRSQYAIKGKHRQYIYFCNYIHDDTNAANVFAFGTIDHDARGTNLSDLSQFQR